LHQVGTSSLLTLPNINQSLRHKSMNGRQAST